MTQNPIIAKIAAPYSRALFDHAIDTNALHRTTADVHNLLEFLNNTPELVEFLSNPLVNPEAKRAVLSKTVKSKVNKQTFTFLGVLILRNRINILKGVIENYLSFVYQNAAIRMLEVVTPVAVGGGQKRAIIRKLKQLTKARELRLTLTVDPTLIGGIVIKSESKILDYSVKNQLQSLAKHLDTVLEI